MNNNDIKIPIKSWNQVLDHLFIILSNINAKVEHISHLLYLIQQDSKKKTPNFWEQFLLYQQHVKKRDRIKKRGKKK